MTYATPAVAVVNWLGYTIAITDSAVDAYLIARQHVGATIRVI